MVSCLNSDVLEKRFEYPGGWHGGECFNGHSVFGKSTPLGAAWCLQSTWLQHVPKMGGSGTSWSNAGEGWEGEAAAQPPGDQQQQQQLNVHQILSLELLA